MTLWLNLALHCQLEPQATDVLMRSMLIGLVLSLNSLTSSAEEMSKQQCGPMVDGTKAFADQLKRMDVAFAKLEMKKNAELTSGEIFYSAKRVEAAHQKALASLKESETTAEDLTKRHHDCADVTRDTMRAEAPTAGKKMAPLFPKPSAPQ